MDLADEAWGCVQTLATAVSRSEDRGQVEWFVVVYAEENSIVDDTR